MKKTISLEEAKKLLNSCTRSECRDHAFGDREIFWCDAHGRHVAEGYNSSVWIYSDVETQETFDFDFSEKEARQLLSCGTVGTIDRNDTTGPDDYVEGRTMSGLTIEGVRKELTGN